jgi:hypothetical protein
MKEISYHKFLDDDEEELIRIRLWIEKGNVKDLVVQYESKIRNKWYPIIRYDCSHGFFHRDSIYPNGSKEKQAIEIITLEDAVNYAEQDIKDRWEFYKDRFVKKL